MSRSDEASAPQRESVNSSEEAPRVHQRHRQTLTETLSAGILGLARSRGLRPGDLMPNAKALAEHFEVATPTIREALRSLEATGSIELRHGSGIYVGANLGRILLPNPHADEASIEILLQMLEARLLIEPSLARMAANRRLSAERIESLREALVVSEHQEPQAPPNPLTFHRQLARASGNIPMFECIDALLTIRWREQRMLRRLFDDRAHDRDQHRQILDAVLARDADQAYDLTHRHLEEIRSVVVEASTADQDGHRAAASKPTA